VAAVVAEADADMPDHGSEDAAMPAGAADPDDSAGPAEPMVPGDAAPGPSAGN